MLVEVKLENFKCFDNYSIKLQNQTVIVGKNNAGKSTLAEAIKLISVVTERAEHLRFFKPPKQFQLALALRGVSPSLSNLNITLDKTLFNQYKDPPATITAFFLEGQSIKIYLGEKGEIHAIIRDSEEDIIKTKGGVRKENLPKIHVMPPISPLSREETVLTKDYVKQNLSTKLSSQHFRNQLMYLDEYFEDFRSLAEETWGKLQVKNFDYKSKLPNRPIKLWLREENFTAEVGWMGDGLQMWLQIMWFLARVDSNSTVMLDEPDIYMHADLQKKLIRILKNRYKQIIITTHSGEIIAETPPKNVLVVDKEFNEGTYIGSLSSLQSAVDELGSNINLQLSRLWDAKKLILVEGKDMQILKQVYDIIYPATDTALDTIPHFPVGGWSGWVQAKAISEFTQKNFKNEIRVYAIFDSDYHPQTEIIKRKEEAEKNKISLHVWTRKEIENYLLIPELISNIICVESNTSPSTKDIKEKIEEIADEKKKQIEDKIATEIQQKDKKLMAGTAHQKARKIVNTYYKDFNKKIIIVPGKEMISTLSKWTQTSFGVNLSANKILSHMKKRQVPKELKEVIKSIHNSKLFESFTV